VAAQMMRRNTIALAVLLAALAGYYYFFELGKSDTKPSDKLLNFKPEDAAGVALDFPGRAIVLQRDAQGRWKLAAPLQAPADDQTVASIVSILSTSDIKRTLDKKPSQEDLKNFGLAPPTVKVTVTLKSGLTLPILNVGAKTPIGDSTYAQRANDPAVYLTDGSLSFALDRQPEDLRDKSILPLPQEPIARLEINAGGKPLVLTKDEKEQWKIEAPIQAPANGEAVNQYIFALARLQARSFIDNPSDPRKYGMDKPAVKVTLGGAGGKTLAAIEAGKSGNAWFARRDGETTIFAIDENSYKSLVKTPEDFKAQEKKPEEKKAEEKKEEKKP
jgi:hypothetical protein